MSRVGKNPVPIPAGVTIELKGQHLKAKGKRGELQLMVHDDVSVAREGEALVFKPRTESRRARSRWQTRDRRECGWKRPPRVFRRAV